MDANYIEVGMSQVLCLLDELKGKKFTRSHWEGYHPKIYCKVRSKEWLDKKVAELCAALSNTEPSRIRDYSLEMQIWWRDHQAADEGRKKIEQEAARRKKLRKQALAKLTMDEIKALNIKLES